MSFKVSTRPLLSSWPYESVFSVGPSAIERRSSLLQRFTNSSSMGSPTLSGRPSARRNSSQIPALADL